MIPENFAEWQKCIEKECGISLTRVYALERLAILQELKHPQTLDLIKHYGVSHVNRLIGWFQQIAESYA